MSISALLRLSTSYPTSSPEMTRATRSLIKSPIAVGGFSDAPIFVFGGDRLRFVAYWFGNAYGDCGSASAFLPQ